MAVMHTTLWGASSSFGMMQASGMAHKAFRELQRAREAKSSQERIDAAINCAITSWHMVDRTWNGIVSVGRTDQVLARLLGAPKLPIQKADLVQWAITSCPELVLCQGICNGSKHVQSEGKVQTRTGSPDAGSRGIAMLTIVDGGAERDALEVLQAAVSFWGLQATNAGAMQ